MGSLVPGWDAELSVPRELAPDEVDIDKEPEPEGYFARLKSQRHSHGGHRGHEKPSLGRSSAPLTSLPHSATMAGPVSRTSTGPMAATNQQFASFRSSSISHTGGLSLESHDSVRHRLPHHEAPHKYPFTDWAEELSTLRQGPPRRSATVGHDEKHTGACPEEVVGHEKRGAAWWRSLEAGALNEHPDAPEAQGQRGAGAGGHSTFVTQFAPPHHLDFGEREREGEAEKGKE